MHINGNNADQKINVFYTANRICFVRDGAAASQSNMIACFMILLNEKRSVIVSFLFHARFSQKGLLSCTCLQRAASIIVHISCSAQYIVHNAILCLYCDCKLYIDTQVQPNIVTCYYIAFCCGYVHEEPRMYVCMFRGRELCTNTTIYILIKLAEESIQHIYTDSLRTRQTVSWKSVYSRFALQIVNIRWFKTNFMSLNAQSRRYILVN